MITTVFDLGLDELLVIVVIVIGLPVAVWAGVRMLRDPGDGPGSPQ
jgi:hypothetical protein